MVVPPNDGGKTDLESVPWFLWWLVASYGNHTQAALLHDALIVDRCTPPVPRQTADRILLVALREPGQKTGVFRHWLMWAAVSVFGTMRRPLLVRPVLFSVQVLAVWVLAVWGAMSASDAVWPNSMWGRVAFGLVAVVASAIVLVALGMSWRSRVDLDGSWVLAPVVLTILIGIPLVVEWSGDFDFHQTRAFWMLLLAEALLWLGLLWGFAVDRKLRWRLWPTALVGLPVAVLPVALVGVSVSLVWLLDIGASLAAAPEKVHGKRRGVTAPVPPAAGRRGATRLPTSGLTRPEEGGGLKWISSPSGA
jgi:hypothetical protein